MTVGIAAACEGEAEDGPHMVVAADRMVTSGRATRIEYEHTRSKLDTVVDDSDASVNGVHCVAASAGAVSYADDFFTKLDKKLSNQEPAGVQHVATMGADVIQELTRERGNRQVLNQFDISLEDLHTGNVSMSDEIIQQLLSEVSDQKGQILNNLQVIFAGTDHTGTNIFSIPDGNVAPHNRIGYHAIGSGAQPARSSFIRSRYDVDCTIEQSLLAVTEAKRQSEEAQGVGSKMDISVINNEDGCSSLTTAEDVEAGDDSEVEELADLYKRVSNAEQEARESTLGNSDYDY